ncbi:MAG: 2-amino-4-hydroxy-6-hydroxymethyldihydropteridine diphosphokinase [Acidobacteria bacterium]|nr:2-amino-4-hydroxy-6-hydroxymethyldihydropteridine diphosphokinase [Acidobacteriota bacterium]MBI3281755.1 2-amino-4-hydroxy-6-hydroxymethyldihydropteridine diphosphokinase [Acidobacteriota bacterium]
MKTIYLGLGSNVGDREQALRETVRRLQSPELRITRLSAVYETSPRDAEDQPWFLNMVVEARTSLFPMRLLLRVLNIERAMGRKRIFDKGPRVIDIDILLYGKAVIDSAQLVVPHPRMLERRFVLEPLAELAPDLRHPVVLRRISDLLEATEGQATRRVEFRPLIPGE